MIPVATSFKEFYADHHQIQVLDTPGYQSAKFQAGQVFVVEHRCERIRAILQTRPQGTLGSRQFQPLGAALGQQGTEADTGDWVF
jgi:hypothetical protein